MSTSSLVLKQDGLGRVRNPGGTPGGAPRRVRTQRSERGPFRSAGRGGLSNIRGLGVQAKPPFGQGWIRSAIDTLCGGDGTARSCAAPASYHRAGHGQHPATAPRQPSAPGRWLKLAVKWLCRPMTRSRRRCCDHRLRPDGRNPQRSLEHQARADQDGPALGLRQSSRGSVLHMVISTSQCPFYSSCTK